MASLPGARWTDDIDLAFSVNVGDDGIQSITILILLSGYAEKRVGLSRMQITETI
jgi:hypothetical protein